MKMGEEIDERLYPASRKFVVGFFQSTKDSKCNHFVFFAWRWR